MKYQLRWVIRNYISLMYEIICWIGFRIDAKLIIHSRRTEECYYDKGDIESLSYDLKLIKERLN